MAVQRKAARSGAKKASRKRKPKPKPKPVKAKAKPKAKTKAKTKTKAKAIARITAGKRGKATKAVRSAAKKPATKGGRKSTRRKAVAKAGARGFSEISDLAELMEQHGLVEVEYERSKDGASRIHVKRAGAVQAAAIAAPAAPSAPSAPVAEPASAPVASESESAVAEDLHAFKSPMVGTFYRAPSPEASPFASVGDSVEVAGTVCIIEAMKVMNEITPDASGEVVSIEVENGEAVEFGQTLMLLRTH